MNSNNKRDELQYIILNFILCAVVMENNSGEGKDIFVCTCPVTASKGDGLMVFCMSGFFPKNTPCGIKIRCDFGEIVEAD
jgi:hypothetical protein